MQKSKIGEGNVESGAVSVNERRTSSSVLLDPAVVERHPQLQPMVLQLQTKAQKLLNLGMPSLRVQSKNCATVGPLGLRKLRVHLVSSWQSGHMEMYASQVAADTCMSLGIRSRQTQSNQSPQKRVWLQQTAFSLNSIV